MQLLPDTNRAWMVSFIALQQMRLQIKHRPVSCAWQMFFVVEHAELAGFFKQYNFVRIGTLRAQCKRQVERFALSRRERQYAVSVDRLQFIEQHHNDGPVNINECGPFLACHLGVIQRIEGLGHLPGSLKGLGQRK